MAIFSLEEAPNIRCEVQEIIKPKITAYFAPKRSYKGEFGFDWCLWNIETDEITHFQDIEVSNISHVFNEAENKFVTATHANEDLQQQLLKKQYTDKEVSTKKPYYAPWLLLAKGKSATLTLVIKELVAGDENKRFIQFEAHNDYDIQYKEQLNTDIKIPYKGRDKFDITLTAKNVTNTTSFIKVITEDNKAIAFIELAPNKLSNLPIKLIPVVLKGNDTLTQAQSIYTKAKGAKGTTTGTDLENYLNNYAFNQAAIQCDVKDFNEHIAIDVNDPYSLWSKLYNGTEFKDWKLSPEEQLVSTIGFNDRNKELKKLEDVLTTKQNALASDLKNKTLKKQVKAAQTAFEEYKKEAFRPEPWLNEDGDYAYKEVDPEHPEQLRDDKVLLMNVLETEYKRLHPNNNFKGALVFVTDKELEGDTAGYSETNPLRNQGVFIGNNILQNAPAYVHELGHMLGLNHVFFKDEKEANKANETIGAYLEDNSDKQKKREIDLNVEIERLKNTKKRMEGDLIYMTEESYPKKQIDSAQEELDEIEKELKIIEDELKNKIPNQKQKSNLRIISNNVDKGILVTCKSTSNYMDYTPDCYMFNKHQVLNVKKESNDFYS